MAEARELEVGCICLTVHLQFAQAAHVVPRRVEDAGDSVEDGEISMLEGVIAADGAVAGIIDDPRTKSAGGVNFPGRLGILHHCLEVHWCAGVYALGTEAVDDELQRELVRIVGLDG